MHDAFSTIAPNGKAARGARWPLGPARAAWRAPRALLLALLLLGSLWPGAQTQAWDVERMLGAARRLGPQAVTGTRELQLVLVSSRSLDDAGKLDAVNLFFNQHIAFHDDTEVWNQVDYWASPLESLSQGQGDCEDFAIAKYFSLLALGMPTAKLRLVYVRAHLGSIVQPHMVLAYYASAGAEPLVLDNLVGDVRKASQRPDLVPVFSFNSDGLWQGVGTQAAGDPVARLSRWREVLAKARAEGFQ